MRRPRRLIPRAVSRASRLLDGVAVVGAVACVCSVIYHEVWTVAGTALSVLVLAALRRVESVAALARIDFLERRVAAYSSSRATLVAAKRRSDAFAEAWRRTALEGGGEVPEHRMLVHLESIVSERGWFLVKTPVSGLDGCPRSAHDAKDEARVDK